ncbi:MAG TPA: PAS domain S-box protein [Gemmataceae bacterium]|jgi:PAS domain S-box-containing protein
MNTDRNLLFGVLALQADLIDTQQFVEICSLWSTRKNVLLADLLLERGWIVPADKEHVDYLLERKLHKHGDDIGAGLATVSDDVKRSLSVVNDPDIQRSLAAVRKPRISDPNATIDHVVVSRPRYSRTCLHASGGIGQVWLAHDSALGRDVALKEIRPERRDDRDIQARFLQEARITGQLEHPGVVSVYELSRGEQDRRPFYTMRFVKGRTLSEAAQAYHVKRLAGQADALDLLRLLNAFVAICNTVAYAHSRGIVHRDLKGQNIVLGDFGEVVVLDWGLAKFLHHPETEAKGSLASKEIEYPGDSNLTIQGQTVGTPAYMAPEQAEGRPDLIDFRTDVYGLGAILYEILTGQPPFTGRDTREVLRKVQEEEPIAPSLLCAETPPALERACLRALAKKPSDRYTSAAELGQEVQGWQEVQRREAEEALRASEALYHSLVETLPLSVWRKDLKGRFTFANSRFCELMGRSLDHVIGKTDFDFFPAELAAKYQRDDAWVCTTKTVMETTEEHVTATGEKRYVQVIKTPIVDPLDECNETQGIFWDLTDRKQVEEELRKSQERFELAVLGSQDGLWDWDMQSNEVYFSPRYKSMLGYTVEEFPSRMEEWEKRIHPDDGERVMAAVRDYLAGSSPQYEVEHRLRHKDGSFRWVLARGVALRDASGKPYRMAGSHEDITDRKRAEEALRASEERYRSVIAAMQDGIVLLDTDGSIRACNASAERILGLSAEQIIGRTPSDMRWGAIHEDGTPFPGETHPPMVTLRTGRPLSNVVMGVRKPDNTLTWISINSQPLFRADGTTLCGVAASFEDITERKTTEAQLQSTTAELASFKEQSRHRLKT